MGIKDLNADMKSKLLEDVFNRQKELTYGALEAQIRISFKEMYGNTIGDNQAKEFIKQLKEAQIIHQPDGKNKPYTQVTLGLEF